jgi:hypothetical protein
MSKLARLLLGMCALTACAGRGPYHVTESYKVISTAASHCQRAQPAILVPELPAADRLLGDIVVSCERNCPRDYAIETVLQLAEQRGASRVSSLSCVQRDEGWVCVAHASATPLCEEGS